MASALRPESAASRLPPQVLTATRKPEFPENLMDRKVPFEDEVPAVFDLIDRVVSAQVDGLAILLGKLGRQKPTPVVQTLLEDGSAQLIGSRLQRLGICGRQKGIVVFAKRHALAAQFDLHEVVPV